MSSVKNGNVDFFFDNHKVKIQQVKYGRANISYRIPTTCRGNHIISAVYTDGNKTVTKAYD